MNNDRFETIICAKPGIWRRGQLRELIRYKSLIKMFIKRDIIVQYKQTVLGLGWMFINPIISSLVFTLVFGSFIGLASDSVPHFLFYLAGNTLWSVFSGCTTSAANLFLENGPLFSKVYFPRITMPIAHGAVALINYAIKFIILLLCTLFVILFSHTLHVRWTWLLLVILPIQMALLGNALGLIVASVSIRYRDLIYATSFAVQLFMYITPVIYPLSSVSSNLKLLMLINPMTPIICNFRYFLFGSGEYLGWPWLLSAVVTILLFIIGVWRYEVTSRSFVDTI